MTKTEAFVWKACGSPLVGHGYNTKNKVGNEWHPTPREITLSHVLSGFKNHQMYVSVNSDCEYALITVGIKQYIFNFYWIYLNEDLSEKKFNDQSELTKEAIAKAHGWKNNSGEVVE